MLISTALLLDSIIPNSVCTPAKLPCRRVEVGYEIKKQLQELEIKNEKQKTVNQFYSTCFPFYKIFSLE
jgi:hypothetical protein